MSLFEQVLIAAAPYLVPLILAVLTVLVKAAFERMPSNVQPTLKAAAKTAVAAVEQIAGAELNGPGKKEKAIELVEDQLSHFGFKVPTAIISAVIEEAVKEMNLSEKANVTTEKEV